MPNITRWGFTDGIRLARILRKELNDPTNYTTEEFLAAGVRALKKYPNEWVIHYVLCDKCQAIAECVNEMRQLF